MPPAINPLVTKFERRQPLTDKERAALQGLFATTRKVPARTDLAREGDSPNHSILLLDGFAGRVHEFPDGRRQIMALNVLGDFVDLHGFLLEQMDHTVATLTDCRIAEAPHARLRELTEEHPRLTRMLWLDTLSDGAIARQWQLGTGRRTSQEHVAHLLCEVCYRLRAVGAAEDDSFDFPLTQAELGDVLAISTVHVNRVLQEVRAKSLFTWRGARVTIRDWDALCQLAGFNPMYLQFRARTI